MADPRSILLLCDEHRGHAGNLLQHVRALATLSRHDVRRFNPIERAGACAELDLDEFDAVAIHYSIAIWSERYLPPVLSEKIAAFRGLKLQYIQDDYRLVDSVTAKMRELGVDVLFTSVPEPAASEAYETRLPGVTRLTTLLGYVADELVGRPTPLPGDRPLDVGYRARDLPFWLGRLGREKVEIATGFLKRAPAYGLCCDISTREEDRIYGEAWNRFVASSRATLGTESGSSIVDFDGSLEARGKDYVARRPDATRAQVERDLTGPYEGNVVMAAAPPRLFEAAALRTAMILFPGRYSGIVEPGVHYIPLEKDFSNMDAVVERLRDTSYLEELTARANEDLVASGRYSLQAMVDQFDRIVDERSPARAPCSKPHFRRARLRRRLPSWRRPSKLRVVTGRVLIPVAGIVLVARDAPLRRLALIGLADPQARAAGLAADLRHLTALRYGVRRGSFHVEAEFDPDERLLFLSSRPGASKPGAAGALAAAVASALESGAVESVVWNHSRVNVAAGIAGGTLLAVPVGRHGVDGAYNFRALPALTRSRPKAVLDALEPLLHEQAQERAPLGVEA